MTTDIGNGCSLAEVIKHVHLKLGCILSVGERTAQSDVVEYVNTEIYITQLMNVDLKRSGWP